jgi:hypothetical protein
MSDQKGRGTKSTTSKGKDLAQNPSLNSSRKIFIGGLHYNTDDGKFHFMCCPVN